MSASKPSEEMRNAIVWLERQPGVRNVVRGKYVRTNHSHAPGHARVAKADERHVVVRVYDRLGTQDLSIYASPSGSRDAWIAAIATGPIGQNGNRPDPPKKAKPVVADAPDALHVSSPESAAVPTKTNAAQIYDVTPDLATTWLERNTRNRDLRDVTVRKYAAAMKKGQWKISADAIAFDVNGSIVNGQHRLWAVIESGCTVQMMVAFGLDPDVVTVLDDHLKRTLVDVQKIRRPGQTIQTMHAAIANMLIQTSIDATAIDKRGARERVTREDQLDAIDRHWDALQFTFRDCFRSTKQRGIVMAPVLTPVARAYYTQDHERLKAFGRALLTGVVEDSQSDRSAILLRNLLTTAALSSARPTPDVVYRKTERALAAFLAAEKISTLYEAPHELFPLPDDRPAKGR